MAQNSGSVPDDGKTRPLLELLHEANTVQPQGPGISQI